jgi:cbb3-type cytochrome oxidase maturation protein
MDILFLLIPMSVFAMFGVIGVFAWAVQSGQFDELEDEGARILEPEAAPLDGDQAPPRGRL